MRRGPELSGRPGTGMRRAFGFVLLVTLLGLPGAVLLAVGITRVVRLHTFLSHARPVTGHVVALTHLRSHEDGDTYRLEVEYPSPEGASRRFAVETGSSRFVVGREIEVLCMETQPPDARVRGIETTWSNPVTFTVVGLAWASFAVFILVIGLRHQAPVGGSGP